MRFKKATLMRMALVKIPIILVICLAAYSYLKQPILLVQQAGSELQCLMYRHSD